jgi:hypothetical protein
VAVLDVSEIRRVACPMCGMAILPARAGVRRTLAFGESNAFHFKIRHGRLRCVFLRPARAESQKNQQAHGTNSSELSVHASPLERYWTYREKLAPAKVGVNA